MEIAELVRAPAGEIDEAVLLVFGQCPTVEQPADGSNEQRRTALVRCKLALRGTGHQEAAVLRADHLPRDGDRGSLEFIDLAGGHARDRGACFHEAVRPAERREVGGDGNVRTEDVAQRVEVLRLGEQSDPRERGRLGGCRRGCGSSRRRRCRRCRRGRCVGGTASRRHERCRQDQRANGGGGDRPGAVSTRAVWRAPQHCHVPCPLEICRSVTPRRSRVQPAAVIVVQNRSTVNVHRSTAARRSLPCRA